MNEKRYRLTDKILPPERKGDLGKRKESILIFYEYSRRSARVAILCAVRAGFELLAAKEALPYGKFEQFKKTLNLPIRTAANYMHLAIEFEKRQDLQLVANLKAVPNPSQIFTKECLALVDSIQKCTDGKTLTQLYFDWGIKNTAQSVGGANHLHQFLRENYPDHPEYIKMSLRDLPKEIQKAWTKHVGQSLPTEEFNRIGFQAKWRMMVQDLRENGLDKKTYSYLTRHELEEVHGTLIDVKKEIMEALKK